MSCVVNGSSIKEGEREEEGGRKGGREGGRKGEEMVGKRER